MARRNLSTQGRVLAAGVSIAVGSALVGFMAAGDHSADATQGSPAANPSADGANGASGASATPSDGSSYDGSSYDGRSYPGGVSDPGFQPQPQTRTGGS